MCKFPVQVQDTDSSQAIYEVLGWFSAFLRQPFILCVCVRACVRACVCVRAYVRACVCTSMCACMHACTHVCVIGLAETQWWFSLTSQECGCG